MSCDHELANEWARCRGKNASYITIYFVPCSANQEEDYIIESNLQKHDQCFTTESQARGNGKEATEDFWSMVHRHKGSNTNVPSRTGVEKFFI